MVGKLNLSILNLTLSFKVFNVDKLLQSCKVKSYKLSYEEL